MRSLWNQLDKPIYPGDLLLAIPTNALKYDKQGGERTHNKGFEPERDTLVPYPLNYHSVDSFYNACTDENDTTVDKNIKKFVTSLGNENETKCALTCWIIGKCVRGGNSNTKIDVIIGQKM
tara:strand:- start:15 stop:377 length:363 start_codon:yes stop_codon:yes gene_type:complete